MDQYIENLKHHRIRINGMCKTPKYREIEVLDDNVNTLLKFIREQEANGLKYNTRINYLYLMTKLMEFLKDKKFKQTTKDDILNFFDLLKKDSLKEISLNSYKFKINNFFLWLNGGKEYPDCIAWLKPKRMKYIMLPKDIPTLEQIMKLVETATTERDKALVFCGYESCARLTEFKNLRICDCEFDDYGCKLHIHGSKTDERVVRIVDSVPYLKQWLNVHPQKNNVDSPIWVEAYRSRPKFTGKPLVHTGILKIIKRLARKSGFDERKFTFHKLRHRRISELVRAGVPERIIKKIAGWRSNSQVIEVYYQLNPEEEDKVILDKFYEQNKGKKIEERITKAKTCIKCQKENPIDAKFCFNCYNPLSLEAIEDMDYVRNAIGQVLSEAWEQTNPKEALPSIVEKFKQNNEVS